MKRKGSNCVEIISDQGEAATASNLNEYTLHRARLETIATSNNRAIKVDREDHF